MQNIGVSPKVALRAIKPETGAPSTALRTALCRRGNAGVSAAPLTFDPPASSLRAF
jgi:hypothetical protein